MNLILDPIPLFFRNKDHNFYVKNKMDSVFICAVTGRILWTKTTKYLWSKIKKINFNCQKLSRSQDPVHWFCMDLNPAKTYDSDRIGIGNPVLIWCIVLLHLAVQICVKAKSVADADAPAWREDQPECWHHLVLGALEHFLGQSLGLAGDSKQITFGVFHRVTHWINL